MIYSVERPKQWWTKKEFIIYGYHVFYYKFPHDRILCLCEEDNPHNQCIVPTFDIRQSGESLIDIIESAVKQTVDNTKEENKGKTIYCHIVRHEDSAEIGIVCETHRMMPVTDFVYESTIKRAEKRLNEVDFQLFMAKIESNQHLLDDMNKTLDIVNFQNYS